MVNQKLLNQPLLRLLRAELRRVERGRPPDVRLLEAKVPLVAHPADTLREEACQPAEVPLPKTSSVMRQLSKELCTLEKAVSFTQAHKSLLKVARLSWVTLTS